MKCPVMTSFNSNICDKEVHCIECAECVDHCLCEDLSDVPVKSKEVEILDQLYPDYTHGYGGYD